MDEEEVLDHIFEQLPDKPDQEWGYHMYPSRKSLPRAEMYVDKNGECWRITATRHPHPDDPEAFS